MKIFFEVELGDNTYIGFEDIMTKVDHDAELKAKLSKPRYGNSGGEVGKVTIQFFNHSFVITEEYIARVLLTCYVHAANNILVGKTYQYNLEILYKDWLVFDYVDCREIGIRIRQYSRITYDNDSDQPVFWSDNYMLQEIIVPKKEFVEQTIICSEKYFAYIEKVNFPDPHLEVWKKIVSDLKDDYNSSALFFL